MAFELSTGDAIRSASGFLSLLVGGFLLARARGAPRVRGVALVLAGIGLMGAVTNFASDDMTHWLVADALAASGLVAAMAGVWMLLRGAASRRLALAIVAFSLIAAGLAASSTPPIDPDELYRGEGLIGRAAALAYSVLFAPFPHLACAVAILWAREARGLDERRANGLALLAFGLALFPAVVIVTWGYAIAREAADALGVAMWLPSFAVLIAVGAAWVCARGTAPWSRRVMALGLPLTATGLLLVRVLPGDAGINGIARLIGLAFVAVAVFRLDALDAGFRPRAMRRGAATSLFFAILLIVAEVAQNFFSAEYGLLMGGVVAGALLVAARPIERALEGHHAGRDPARAPAAAGDARERSFLAAARKFHKDGVFTREEERELMILAEHLGIPASRAYELRDEVESEGS